MSEGKTGKLITRWRKEANELAVSIRAHRYTDQADRVRRPHGLDYAAPMRERAAKGVEP